MEKRDTKKLLIEVGAELIYKNGYSNTGILDILNKAGVPKGSFYFYFKSKEDFCLQLIDFFVEMYVNQAVKILVEEKNIPPRERLKSFFSYSQCHFEGGGCTKGCPLGNLILEMSEINENIRLKLVDGYQKMNEPLIICIEEGIQKGEISSDLDKDELTLFIQNSWEGALMNMKLTRNSKALVLFNKFIFENFLR